MQVKVMSRLSVNDIEQLGFYAHENEHGTIRQNGGARF